MKKPYLLEVMGSASSWTWCSTAVKGVPSRRGGRPGAERVEELLASSGYLKK